jgi:diguanylate cyclase (GGDEF)-like protein/PAS domain S-box-containing protein
MDKHFVAGNNTVGNLALSSTPAGESGDLLAAILDSTPALIAAVDTDCRFTVFNAAYASEFRTIFGVDPEVGSDLAAILAELPEDQRAALALFRQALQGEISSVTATFGDPSRSRRCYELRFSPIRAADGRIIGATQVGRDITERARREAHLAFLDELGRDFAHLLSPIEIMATVGAKIGAYLQVKTCNFAVVDEQQDTIWINEGWRAAGVPSLHRVFPIRDYLSEQFRQACRAGETVAIRDTRNDSRADAAAFAALEIRAFVSVPFHFAGERKYLLFVTDSRPRDWRPDELELFQELANRIFPRVERARAADALRQSEARYRALVSASSQVLYRMNADWSEMRQLQGGSFIADTEKPNRNWLQEYIHPDDQKHVLEAIGAAVRTGSVFEFEHRVRRLDGSLGWTASRAVPVRNAAGEIVEWFGAASDVTARKHAEQQIQASEERYRTLFANMTEGFALGEPILDDQGRPVDYRYLEVNEAFYLQTGIPLGVEGRPLREVLPRLEQSWIDRFCAVALSGQPDHIESYNNDTRRHYDVRVYCPSPGRFAILFRDITAQKRMVEALQDSEQRYQALFNNKTMGVAHQRIVTNETAKPVDFVYEAMNDVCLRMIGMQREEVIGKRATEVFPGIQDFEFDFIGEFGRIGLQGGDGDFEYYFPPLKLWISVYAYSPKRGECTVIFTDVTARKNADAALQQSEKRLTLALKAAGTAVWEMDVGTQEIIPASDLVFTMLGYAPGDIQTSPEWLALIHDEDLPGVPEMIQEVIEGRRDSYWRELRLRAKDGRWHWILSQATATERDAQGKAIRLVGTHTDIDERKQAAERVREAAQHDPLTGLPNRALLFEYGSHLVAAACRNHSRGALLFIDLDRFKPINDIYGHDIGDRVLQEVGRRLAGCTRQEDVVGRLGGDEFIIILPHVDASRYSAAVTAQHVLDSISRPFPIDRLELSISPSIGISYYPEHATDISALIHTADRAMYQAKQSGRANYQFYTPELDWQADAAYALEARLKEALRHGGLELHYQPVVDIKSGKLIGAEALARLSGHDGQAISPARFIPVAESAGLIGELGEWVAAQACRQHAAWLAQGLRVAIAINVSPLQFRQRDFAQRLGTIVADNGIDPYGIQVEVTESAVMENVEEAIAILHQLKSFGVKVALDDFGTGYSSLSSLSSLPLDKLKVDQSFVRRIEGDPASRAITRAMIALGRALNLEIVAEGIETADTLGYLRSEGCDQAQGYWVSHPLPAQEFAQWYRQQTVH